ncbi:MAG: VOC family protein [Gemmatimonadota bacterium]
MKKLTPVIIVEAIEPCLPFWAPLGFNTTASVPEGDRLGFSMLASGEVEIMYQTVESVKKDAAGVIALPSRTNLFIEVDSLDEVVPALKGAEITIPVRDTFYGSREIGVRAPCGTQVTFAEFKR